MQEVEWSDRTAEVRAEKQTDTYIDEPGETSGHDELSGHGRSEDGELL